jgi:hypothetical protein
MTAEHIEQLMTRMNLPWKQVVKNMWNIDDPDDNLPGVSVSIEPRRKPGRELVKFVTFICDVPHDAGPEFFMEFLRLNFRVDHGTFALESKSEMCYIDTLELANMDPNEFEATFRSMQNAARTFQDKFDIDFYTMGKPQF